MKVKEAEAMYFRAIDLYDSGYSATDENYPGLLRSRYGAEDIEVTLEIWFFIRGAIFGMGHAFVLLEK